MFDYEPYDPKYLTERRKAAAKRAERHANYRAILMGATGLAIYIAGLAAYVNGGLPW